MKRRNVIARLLAPALLLALGCRADDGGGTPKVTQTLTVFAASSLAEAFAELGRDFEAAHPGVQVAISFAGSQALRLQIEQGAAADVFASANPEHLAVLHASGALTAPVVFARNELVVIVPGDGETPVTAFGLLPRATRVVLGAPGVPVGAYTRTLLTNATSALGGDFGARVLERVVSEESNVRLVRAKVELGEADAAIVYRTDAVASKRVRQVPIPPSLNVRAEYPIARVTSSTHPELGDRFIEFVRSPAGQALLGRHGFVVGP